MSEEVKVVAMVEVRPGQEAAMLAAARSCIPPTRQEAGCISYMLAQDRDNPLRFAFLETWKDAAALETHLAQPHLKAFMAEVAPLTAGEVRILRLEEVA